MPTLLRVSACALSASLVIPLLAQRGPSFVDITWMSLANLHYQIGATGVVTDGYFTRIPQAAFYGGPSGLAGTREAYRPDVEAVRRVLSALGGPPRVNLLLTGHSHWDHSFDTATWATPPTRRSSGLGQPVFRRWRRTFLQSVAPSWTGASR